MATDAPELRSALQMTARVGPGRRIEIAAPELPEGETVEVIILMGRQRPPRRTIETGAVEGSERSASSREMSGRS